MKFLKPYDVPKNGFRGIIITKIADLLIKSASNHKNVCWWGVIYEPELPAEIVNEMVESL